MHLSLRPSAIACREWNAPSPQKNKKLRVIPKKNKKLRVIPNLFFLWANLFSNLCNPKTSVRICQKYARDNHARHVPETPMPEKCQGWGGGGVHVHVCVVFLIKQRSVHSQASLMSFQIRWASRWVSRSRWASRSDELPATSEDNKGTTSQTIKIWLEKAGHECTYIHGSAVISLTPNPLYIAVGGPKK